MLAMLNKILTQNPTLLLFFCNFSHLLVKKKQKNKRMLVSEVTWLVVSTSPDVGLWCRSCTAAVDYSDRHHHFHSQGSKTWTENVRNGSLHNRLHESSSLIMIKMNRTLPCCLTHTLAVLSRGWRSSRAGWRAGRELWLSLWGGLFCGRDTDTLTGISVSLFSVLAWKHRQLIFQIARKDEWYIQCIRKVFRPFQVFHTLVCYRLDSTHLHKILNSHKNIIKSS